MAQHTVFSGECSIGTWDKYIFCFSIDVLGLVYKCCSNLLLFSYWHFAWLSYLLFKVEYWCLLILCFLKKFISKIFIFGRAGSSLLPKGFLKLWWAGRFSSCGAWAAFVAEHGVPGCARSAVPVLGLSSWGSGVVACRPSCSAARRIFPDRELNPWTLHWLMDS